MIYDLPQSFTHISLSLFEICVTIYFRLRSEQFKLTGEINILKNIFNVSRSNRFATA